MFVAVDRVDGYFKNVFELVGCGFKHVKSPVLPSVVIEFLQNYYGPGLTSKQGHLRVSHNSNFRSECKNSKGHAYQFASQFVVGFILGTFPDLK